MKYTVSTIPHKEQRYETCGDYFSLKKGTTFFRISKMNNEDYEFLVFYHELIESYLLKSAGIKMRQVDSWDKKYEYMRRFGVMTCGCRIMKTSEPGADKHAPYYFQHRFATWKEKEMAKKLRVKWSDYDKAVNALHK